MFHKILIFIILLSILSYAQDKITEEERLKLENYSLKVKDINYQIKLKEIDGNIIVSEGRMYIKQLKEKYKKDDNYDFDINTGDIINLKKEEKK